MECTTVVQKGTTLLRFKICLRGNNNATHFKKTRKAKQMFWLLTQILFNYSFSSSGLMLDKLRINC
jgi:hypothetical protein